MGRPGKRFEVALLYIVRFVSGHAVQACRTLQQTGSARLKTQQRRARDSSEYAHTTNATQGGPPELKV
jgi:hypothetical protein